MVPPSNIPSSCVLASVGAQGKKPIESLIEPVTPKMLFNGAAGPFSAEMINTLTARTSALKLDDLPAGGEDMDSDNATQLPATYLSKTHFDRLQVVFLHAADTNFIWCREVEHATMDNKRLIWQHPENTAYLKERTARPEAIEVLLKGVLAVISTEMFRKSSVTALLFKHGRTTVLEGSAFHTDLDPVTGSDTDKIKGLFNEDYYDGPDDCSYFGRRGSGGVDLRLGGLREDSRHQFCASGRARSVGLPLHRPAQGGSLHSLEQGEAENCSHPKGVRVVAAASPRSSFLHSCAKTSGRS
ncbi:unnamed protein product [Closterium sp. Naga37s-1]|nr:unnamed protein product [Closterium sp. Naga37s-1]